MTPEYCRDKTVFRVKGDQKNTWRTINLPFSRLVKDIIVDKYGDQIEVIFNESIGQTAD